MSLLNRRRALLVYLKLSKLPSEYQEVTYIETTGTQYINTGTKASNKTRIIADFYVGNMTQTTCLFGSRSNNTVTKSFNAWYIYDDNCMRCDYNTLTSGRTFKSYTKGARYIIDFNKNVGKIGDTVYTFTASTFTTPYNLSIFTTMRSGEADTRRWKGRLYSFKMYENDVLIRNFIPCYRKADGVIGLYDIVNHIFYTNAGSGTFSKGEDVID